MSLYDWTVADLESPDYSCFRITSAMPCRHVRKCSLFSNHLLALLTSSLLHYACTTGTPHCSQQSGAGSQTLARGQLVAEHRPESIPNLAGPEGELLRGPPPLE